MTSFQITFKPTAEFAASLYYAVLMRTQAGYVVTSVFVAGLAVWRLASGEETTLWAFWLGIIATFWYGWFTGARKARAGVAARGPLSVSLAVDEAGCTFRSTDSSMWFAWREIETVYLLKSALLILRRNGSNPIPIPTVALSSEQTALVLAEARAAGARVR
jgi:hypothetical protein